MSEILSRLAECKHVTEWVNFRDNRLVVATGDPAPNGGANVRDGWPAKQHEFSLVASAVKRILVPRNIGSRVLASMTGDLDNNRVLLQFDNGNDWATFFPTEDGTQIMKRREGEAAWAAVGLCDDVLGIAVFATEKDGGVLAKIQVVPDEVFTSILSSEQ